MADINRILIEIIVEFWGILLASSIYVLFGFLVAGFLKGILPKDFIEKHLGGRKIAGIFKASLFGLPIPLCSCGVIPAAAGLRQQKASKSAVVSFMISTPETGVDSVAITYALLDPFMTIIRPIAAFFTAIISGLLVHIFDRDSNSTQQHQTSALNIAFPMVSPIIQNNCGCGGSECQTKAINQPQNIWTKIQQGMVYSFGTLLADIGLWLILGIILAALITVFISPEIISSYLGDSFFSMLVMVVISTPLYVCATASTPVAAALALKGLSPGAALVFLLAGPATNMATLTVIAKLLGKKTAFIYVASIVLCSVCFGLIVNWLYFSMGISITNWVQAEQHQDYGIIHIIAAVVLLVLIGKNLIIKNIKNMINRSNGCSLRSRP